LTVFGDDVFLDEGPILWLAQMQQNRRDDRANSKRRGKNESKISPKYQMESVMLSI